MPGEVRVRVDVDERAVRALSSSADMRDLLLDAGEPVVRHARALAPKDTGEGAASIREEAVLDGFVWTVRVSWDRAHFYMYFHDQGTKHIPARPFLEPALEAAIGGIR